MSKVKPESAIQKALREQREQIRLCRANDLIRATSQLMAKPGHLIVEAKAIIAEVEAVSDAQIDDDAFYKPLYDRAHALLIGAKSGQSAAPFR